MRTNLEGAGCRTGRGYGVQRARVRVNAQDLAEMTEGVSPGGGQRIFWSSRARCLRMPRGLLCPLIRGEGIDVKCALDAEGEALRRGIEARPCLIKPNRMELEMAVGRPLADRAGVIGAAKELARRGIDLVAVSLGAEGAILTDGERTLSSPGLHVPVRSTVGAGDSMMAGMIYGLMAEKPLEEVLRRGMACAAASVMAEGTRLTERSTYKSLLDDVMIEEV